MLPKIKKKIHEIRGQNVILDFELAELYGVETRALNQAVKRNSIRFPRDLMFQLTEKEWEGMSSQIVMTSKSKRPQELSSKLTELEIKYNQKFIDVYEALNYLLKKDQEQAEQIQQPERKQIGYKKQTI